VTERRLPPLRALLSGIPLGGVGAAGTGLAWDAVLHARDALLATHESVLTVSNPAHLLLAGGVGLAIAGQAGVVALTLSVAARRIFAVVLVVFAASVATAVVWSLQISARQTAAAQHLVADTAAGIARYRNVDAAIQAGYEPMTPLNSPVIEWVNPTFMKAGRVLDVQRPERLMYVSGPGGLTLAGAMFVLRDGASPPEGIAGAHWHSHQDLCYLRTGAIAGTNGYGMACPSGSASRPTPLMLHVWTVPNPQGAFADDLTPAAIGALFAHD
jgi:hypothetical protein